MTPLTNQDRILLQQIETSLRSRVEQEEASHGKNGKPPNSLWGHMSRVALLAEKIGEAEGVNSTACRLAGLFHDAGKFAGGGYHNGDKPEEEYSVATLHEMTRDTNVSPELIKVVEESILQMYRSDPDPTKLTQVLFDADNLDKLGFLGVANYFIKAGLRGKGVSPSFLYQITVELTYARHAPHCLATQTGRNMAAQRAPETIDFFINLLETIRDDGLFDFRIEEINYNDLIIDVVSPVSCTCGGKLTRDIWEILGMKCTEIHLKHSCKLCGSSHQLRFCRPRL